MENALGGIMEIYTVAKMKKKHQKLAFVPDKLFILKIIAKSGCLRMANLVEC